MDACLANPAASIDLHEVLYGVVTPAGPWGFWGHGLKKIVAPISNIATYGIQAFRNQSRDYKHSSDRSFHSAHSDPDDFSIGTCRSDSDDTLPHTTSAASNNPLSSRATNLGSSDEQRRGEPASTPQNVPEEDRSRASSWPHPMAAVSSASERSGAPSSTAVSAAAVQQPSGSSAQTLQSGSPNTVVQAAAPAGVSSNQKWPTPKSAKLASTEMAKQPGAQASTADETIAAGLSAASRILASTARPAVRSEQVSSLHCYVLVWHMYLTFSCNAVCHISFHFQIAISKCSYDVFQSSYEACLQRMTMSCCKQ